MREQVNVYFFEIYTLNSYTRTYPYNKHGNQLAETFLFIQFPLTKIFHNIYVSLCMLLTNIQKKEK